MARDLLALVIASLVLASCADKRGGDIPYNAAGFRPPDPIAAITARDAYRVGPGDVLNVAVSRVTELSGDQTVDPLGNLSMPLIGKVPAMGKTTDELSAQIASMLGSKYLQNPEVRVEVKESPARRITVDGAVGAPGIYPINGGATLLQAVALAKGTTQEANARKVAVFRTINGQRQAAAFDLTDIRRGIMADPPIYGNDIIVVDSNSARSRFRDILATVPLISLFRPF